MANEYYDINTPFKNEDIEYKLREEFQKIRKEGNFLNVREVEVRFHALPARWQRKQFSFFQRFSTFFY